MERILQLLARRLGLKSTILHQSGFSPFSLNVQWYQYNDFHRRSQTFRSQGEIFKQMLPEAHIFSEALYTFDIGQNDLTAGLFLNMSTAEVKAFLPDNICSQGGRSFWIHNTGPVGCLPYVLDRLMVTAGQIDSVECAGPFNEVCQFYNTKLKEAVEQLRKDLPLAAITYVDVYSVKYDLISHASRYDYIRKVHLLVWRRGSRMDQSYPKSSYTSRKHFSRDALRGKKQQYIAEILKDEREHCG